MINTQLFVLLIGGIPYKIADKVSMNSFLHKSFKVEMPGSARLTIEKIKQEQKYNSSCKVGISELEIYEVDSTFSDKFIKNIFSSNNK